MRTWIRPQCQHLAGLCPLNFTEFHISLGLVRRFGKMAWEHCHLPECWHIVGDADCRFFLTLSKFKWEASKGRDRMHVCATAMMVRKKSLWNGANLSRTAGIDRRQGTQPSLPLLHKGMCVPSRTLCSLPPPYCACLSILSMKDGQPAASPGPFSRVALGALFCTLWTDMFYLCALGIAKVKVFHWLKSDAQVSYFCPMDSGSRFISLEWISRRSQFLHMLHKGLHTNMQRCPGGKYKANPKLLLFLGHLLGQTNKRRLNLY